MIFMFGIIFKTLIIYCVVAFCVRLMGKRQLGELQPGELVVTILISEIAAAPILENEVSLLDSLISLTLLVSFEILSSVFSMKSVRFRLISEGNPVTVIRNGQLLQKQLKKLRFTVNDVLAALRQKDIFNIEDVEYAVIETNGMLSVMLKSQKQPLTPETQKKQKDTSAVPCPVVIDGRIIKTAFDDCNITLKEIEKKIERENIRQNDIVLMTVDKNKKYYIITKKEC